MFSASNVHGEGKKTFDLIKGKEMKTNNVNFAANTPLSIMYFILQFEGLGIQTIIY